MKILKERFVKGKYYFKGKIFATIRAVKKGDKYYLIAESDTHYYEKRYKEKTWLLKALANFSILDLRRKANERSRV